MVRDIQRKGEGGVIYALFTYSHLLFNMHTNDFQSVWAHFRSGGDFKFDSDNGYIIFIDKNGKIVKKVEAGGMVLDVLDKYQKSEENLEKAEQRRNTIRNARRPPLFYNPFGGVGKE